MLTRIGTRYHIQDPALCAYFRSSQVEFRRFVGKDVGVPKACSRVRSTLVAVF
jgi:hypothetical protein